MDTVQANDYHEIVQVGGPAIAPDGERVAFVRKVPDGDEEYEATIHVARMGGETRRFTAEVGVDAQPRWSPSGDRLAFVSTREEEQGDQLWVMPTDGGEARRVTSVPGPIQGFEWSPDGTRLAFTQQATAAEREEGHDLDAPEDHEREEPDPRVVDRLVYRAHEHYFDGVRSHVYVVDLGDDEVRRLTDGDHDHHSPSWVDQETLYYVVRRRGDPDDNNAYDVDAHDLSSGDTETLVETTGWPIIDATPDGRVAYVYAPEERPTLRPVDVRVHDPATGETVVPTDGLDRTLSFDVGVRWDPAGERIYFVTPDEGDYVLRRVPGDASAEPEVVMDGRHVHGFDVGRDAVAVTASEWDHRGDLFVATPAGAEESRLTRVNDEYLDGRAVGQPEELRFENGEGDEIQGWVLTPPDFDPEETYPLAVEIHGGPHAMWSTSGTMWHEFQTLAARGYVVFWSNPRGSTGYGEEFAAAIADDWGDVTTTDVMAGARAVAAREYVDEENVFVTGGSFGGYMVGWLVGHTDYFRAAVGQRGVYDLASFYGSTDSAFKLLEWDWGTTPWEDPEAVWAGSPVAYADRVTTPTLVVHAENDFRVPVNNAEMLHRFLAKNGVDTRLVLYPGEGHELSRSGQPGHVVDRIERIVRWFDGYSEHHDAPPALERDPDDGLSAASEDDGASADE